MTPSRDRLFPLSRCMIGGMPKRSPAPELIGSLAERVFPGGGKLPESSPTTRPLMKR
jgi:hypothetical protein